jgi:uncharacterized protein (TIGR02611 family)
MKSARGKFSWSSLKRAMHLDQLPAGTRRIIVAVVGGVVLVIGLVMLILPGPAFLVIPLGLAILASEFPWARRWLSKARTWFSAVRKKMAAWRRKWWG